MDVSTDVLRLDHIVKTFSGITALADVSFAVRPGEVHALVGENGAGKSTLMGVAAGALAPDSGVVEIGGQRLVKPSPAEAAAMGLAVVYQHATTLDDLTVGENLTLSVPAALRPSRSEVAGWTRKHLAAVGTTARPGVRAEELGPAQRQLVEIARALALESRVLVLDEPTESLTAAESELLFEQIDRLRKAGAGIVYISHRFPEVQRIADRISVLRDGQLRGTFDAAEVTEDDVLQLIVGRQVEHVFPAKRKGDGTAILLEGRGLTGAAFSGVDLAVRTGEILGLAGVEGNGQRDVLRSLAGLSPMSGQLTLEGRQLGRLTPSTAAAAGIVHLPADRHAEGVFLPLTVRENSSVLVLSRISKLGVIDRGQERSRAQAAVRDLKVRTPGIEAPVSTLSGGNQQKVLFARSLEAKPTVLLADEPTRGVDVGARVEIYRLLRDFADDGHAVVALSSDAIELAGLCDRVLVFSRGQVVRELVGDALTERAITGAAITSTATRSAVKPATVSGLSRLRRVLSTDLAPSAILAVIIVVLGILTTARNSLFLSERNISSLLFLATILALAAYGQLTALLVGSIDLSVGPLIGFVIVVMSFYATGGGRTTGFVTGVGICLLVGLAVGLFNGVAVRFVRLPPVIATLVSNILLQGLALLLRPTPGGYIDTSTTDFIQHKVGPVPIAAIIAVVIVLGAEWLLRQSRFGVSLRAVGSDETRARRLGVPVDRAVISAHVVCSLFAVLAGLLLMALVAVGQAGIGNGYTLTSISAVVLGGASIFGGRGSYIGALFGALLIQQIVTATSFLNLDQAWQEWLPGLLILAGAAVFSGARRRTLNPMASTASQES